MPIAKQRAQDISFYMLLAIVGLTVVFMFLPFFKLIALGGILAVLFHPIQVRISKHIKSQSAASLITTILAMIIIALPVYAIGQLVFNEIVSVYSQAKSSGALLDQSRLLNHLSGNSRVIVQNFISTIGQKISDFAGNAFNGITGLLGNIAEFVVGIILVVFTMYYFLKDGQKLRSFIERIFPLSHTHETLLVDKLEMAIRGVVQGSFTMALLQGSVSTIGFYIFGVPQPLLWGVFTVLASLVPTVGTLLSLVPAVLYLFLTGNTAAGIGMTIWAFLSIQGLDNFVSPRLIGHKVDLHPIITLLSILGGITMFGYLGFLIGPILTAMFMSLLDIYSIGLKSPPKK